MKVLWITNVMFPDICEHLSVPVPVTGGWMKSLAAAIGKYCPDVELAVATLHGQSKEFVEEKINGITYFCLPFNPYTLKYNPAIEGTWKKVESRFNPDIVHLHGTEFPFGLAYLKGCGSKNCIASIQGFRRGISRYSLAGIPVKELKKCCSLSDILFTPVWRKQQQMYKGGLIEEEYLKHLHHVIGRTRWDHDHVWAVNPDCKYHFCNETLRQPFFELKKWNVNSCRKYSIFLSQAASPIKGIHKVIEALPLVLRHYPDTEVYVAGNNFLSTNSLKDIIKQNSFARYVKKLMKHYGIENRIHFLGPLNEDGMIEQLQKANVFICPSSIENSPNSLGEAQLIGTPCIASYVGGVPDMVTHDVDCLLYRFEETEMLASCICQIFGDDALAEKLSKNGIKRATERHSPEVNAKRTIEIYKSIVLK